MVLFVIFIGALGFLFSYWFNDSIFIFVALGFSLVSSFVSYWYSDKIILGISHAREAKRNEFFDLYNSVENLSITAGLPIPKIYVMDDPSPNAFATGRDSKNSVICVTTGLLSVLDKTELEGVISHELSHIGNKDILLASVICVLVSVVSLLANWLSRSLFWGRGRRDDDNGMGFIALAITLISVVLLPIAAMLTQLAISRKREFLADASGALLTRYPDGLILALEKISKSNIPIKNVSEVTRGLFISDPYKKKKGSWFVSLWQTHPPVEERVKALKNLDI